MFRFGSFTFDPRSGELSRDGRTQRLTPQSAQVLAMLLERPGALVSRTELRDRIWPDTSVEFDQGLNFCVRQIRIALEDNAGTPRFIETLPRRGYRFLGPVEGSDDAAAPRASPEVRTPPAARKRTSLGVVGILVTALVAAVVWGMNRPARPPLLLAIVPFDADSGLSDLVRYRNRLAEQLVERATKATTGQVGVLGPATTAGWTSLTSVDSIRSRVGAGYVLSGIVRRRGNDVDVFAQLIRTSDRAHIWVARAIDSGLVGPARVGERFADSVASIVLHPERPRRLPR